MNSLLLWPLYLLALGFTTWLIWYWNRGAQKRRFYRAYPTKVTAWTSQDEAFLRCFEGAFRLPSGSGLHLPPERTPMDVYLKLYPEHCIYDAGETTRLTLALRTVNAKLPDDFLSCPLRELSAAYQAAIRP